VEQYFFTTDISHTFCWSVTKFGNLEGLVNRNLFPEFRELCGDTHQFFTDALMRTLSQFRRNSAVAVDSVSNVDVSQRSHTSIKNAVWSSFTSLVYIMFRPIDHCVCLFFSLVFWDF